MSAFEVKKEYIWRTHVSTYDVDYYQRLRLSSQLRLQQEVGELHFGEADCGYQTLYRHGMAFVLSRTSSVICRSPMMGEPVALRSWHRESKGARLFRCYQFLDETGAAIIESVSAFALVDVNGHALLRPSVLEQRLGIRADNRQINGCPDPKKLVIGAPLAPAGERTVVWSDIDWNGHLNNAVYADIACDTAPGGMKGKRVTAFSVEFLKEAFYGERISLQSGEERQGAGGVFWVTGQHGRGHSFTAMVRYEDTEEGQ